MGNKLVSIFMTTFMLMMCVVAIATMGLSSAKRNQDMVVARANSAVVSTDGEVNGTGEVTGVRGSELISSIIGMDKIDKVNVSVLEDGSESTTSRQNTIYANKYEFHYDGTVYTVGADTGKEELLNKIEPDNLYILSYDFGPSKNTVSIVKQAESGD